MKNCIQLLPLRQLFLLIISFGQLQNAAAQDEEKNIVIKEAQEEYQFVRGNSANPVQIKQTLNTMYLCKDFRTNLQVVEFYNDQLEVNDVDIRVNGSKAKYIQPTHDYYNSDGIFYSDARVCYFTLPLEKKGSTSNVVFKKTCLDPRYFTSIFFTEPYAIEQKQVTITVPRWMKIEIKEYNFKGYQITKTVNNKGNEDVYTYTLSNIPAYVRERGAPGVTYVAPHLLIMTKYAEPDGKRITYFNTLADQYGWYHQLVKAVGNDAATVKAKAEEITKGITGDMEKVKAIFQWVQDNIRYIAYEDGIAGFKPEKAQEVLRKKYGDCKGMGNLTAEMLKSIGLDGRVCWLGTNHIAYDYSTPSLGVDNHMICAWLYKGKTYYLDATEKYIGFGEIAERIQGRQVLIEDGEKYLLQTIPVANVLQNTSYEKRTLRIEGTSLKGKVVQTWKGENKEWLLTHLHETKKEKQEETLKKILNEGNANYMISNLKLVNFDNYNADLKIEYDLLFKDAVSAFDKEIYLDVDNRKDYTAFTFDTAKRKLPYQFPFKNHVVFETELQLPQNAKANTMPPSLKIDEEGYSINGQWKMENGKVVYRREIQLKKTWLEPKQLTKWNKDISKLNEFYSNQLTIIQ